MSEEEEYDVNDFEKMPIKCLGPGSRSLLSLCLNPEQLLACESGHARDFRGIAEIIGFSYTQIQNFKRSSDPFSAVLDAYSTLPAGREATVRDLLIMLQEIGRFDVIDDVMPSLQNNLNQYYDPTHVDINSKSHYDQAQILSLDDIVTGSQTMFDAYVCYADPDLDFVRDMTKRLEDSGINLFVRERDLPAGALHYDVFAQLIEKRCGRVLVILSPEFLLCEECEWQIRYATSLVPDQRSRKLIPVVFKSCDSLPPALSMLTKIDFSRGVTDWTWRRLNMSVKMSSSNSGFIERNK